MDLEDWNGFRDRLNDLHNIGRKAPVFDELRAVIAFVLARDGITLKGAYDAALYAENEIKHLTGRTSPRPAVRPVARPPMPVPKLPPSLSQFTSLMHDVTLHEIMMKEIYDSEFRFEGCTNRHELREFISPENGLREKPYSEFTVAQKNMFFVIRKRYKEWCASRGTVPQYSLIEEDIPM